MPVQKRNNYGILIKAVNLLKQSCSVHYKHLWNSKVKNTHVLNTCVHITQKYLHAEKETVIKLEGDIS